MSFIDTAILAIPTAMVLHMMIGLVLKYSAWLANGRTFHPISPAPETSPEPSPDVDLPSLPELLDTAAGLTAKPLPESPEPGGAGEGGEQPAFMEMGIRELRQWGSERQIRGASRMKKALLLEALMAS